MRLCPVKYLLPFAPSGSFDSEWIVQQSMLNAALPVVAVTAHYC